MSGLRNLSESLHMETIYIRRLFSCLIQTMVCRMPFPEKKKTAMISSHLRKLHFVVKDMKSYPLSTHMYESNVKLSISFICSNFKVLIICVKLP